MLPFVKRILIVLLFLTFLLAKSPLLGEYQVYGPDSVVVVANSSMPGSLKVAEAYMQRRRIPEEHLIVLDTSVEERISRKDYLDTIHNPVIRELLLRDLVDAFDGPVDDLGRKTATIFKNKIRYLVLCYGVPSKVQAIAGELAKMDDPYLNRMFRRSNPALIQTFTSGNLARNDASVDGELSLLLKRDIPLRGFVPNPLHSNAEPSKIQDILRVTRLDGPSPEAVIRMLDSSMAGETKGLRGRAYIDEDGRKGGFEIANTWMANVSTLFESLGYDTSHNTARSTYQVVDRFDAPVLYAGWYASNCNGPFTLPGFRFPEGAVAAHLHSFSASSIRSATKGWVGPFVERGVACTFGNVAEPYLRLTHNFEAFFKALSDGWNFADAAYFALPGLSWQGVAIGDPLYRPFAVSLETQMASIGDPLSILQDQYVMIRQANLLEQSGNGEEARKSISRGMMKTPGPALALKLARSYLKDNNKEKAVGSLSFISRLPPSGSMNLGLYAEIADTLAELGDTDSALRIYKNLEKAKIPEKVQLAFLGRGVKVAQEAGNPGLAIEWKAKSSPPPPPKPEQITPAPEK
jgi:uncharacterized protein (TIGR03790 family)